MKKIIIWGVMVVCAFHMQAQLLWKVTGNELEKPSYILGTHHLAPLSALGGINGLQEAFDNSSHVVGEILMEEMMSQESMMLMQKHMFIENDTTLKMLLSSDDFEMVNKFTQENLMLDIEMVTNLKPSFISNNVIVALYMKNVPGFNPQEQLDLYFQQKGIEQNKKTSAFETMEFQVELLFNKQSLQRQAELLVCALSDVDKTFNSTKKLTEAYLNQDIEALYQISLEKQDDYCDPLPGEMEAMLDDRNMRWVKELPRIMKDSSAFVVVGALHLPGEKGVINLLKEQGYIVEPVM